MPIPGASLDVVKQAVSDAVKSGRLWLVTPALSVLAEDVPVNLLTEGAELHAPPAPSIATELLPSRSGGGDKEGGCRSAAALQSHRRVGRRRRNATRDFRRGKHLACEGKEGMEVE